MKHTLRIVVYCAGLIFLVNIVESCKDQGSEVLQPPQNPIVQDDSVRFNRDIHPILLANCAISGCHAGSSPAANFNQETYTGVRAGGATFGTNVIKPGDSTYSSSATNVGSGIMKMLRNVNNPYGNFRMPLTGTYAATGLPDSMIVRIGKWIVQGALNN
jgi:hypothetical protein